MTRVAVLAVGVAMVAWFALEVRGARDQTRAAAIVNVRGVPSRVEIARATRALDQARAVNPDEQLNILRAELALHAGRRLDALSILSAVVQREPVNIDAWLALALVAVPVDGRLSQHAFARVHELAPAVPRPR